MESPRRIRFGVMCHVEKMMRRLLITIGTIIFIVVIDCIDQSNYFHVFSFIRLEILLTMEDIMHDYEYYEARAKDVKFEDITSSQNNADILASLRDNNPGLEYFSIVTNHEDDCDFVVREGDHLGWLGYFAGRNDSVRTLYIENNPENTSLNAFYEGLGRNRSITDLYINVDLGDTFQSLIPFLRNNDSLRELNFNNFDIGLQCARNIALLLDQRSSMKRLQFDETVFDSDVFSQIATALRSQPQIEELCVYGNSVGRNGYVALGNALESCPNLRKLDLTAYDNDHVDGGIIDDEGMNALAIGLKYCHSLTSLELYGNVTITEEGSRSLSAFFQTDTCQLEYLDLGQMNIDDDGMAVLATGLASLPSLKRLSVWDVSISDKCLQHLMRGLVNCNIEELDMSRSMLMDSVSGLRALGTLVRRTANMRFLNLSDTSLTDEGLQSFVEGMANCCSLTTLSLSRNHSITANGLAFLFRAEHFSLCKLALYGINIGDDWAAPLANGLIGNKSLATLDFNNSGITARGWTEFSRLLCDTSSVNNTYLSNHTLVQIGGHGTPSDIVKYLKWNRSHNQAAAICKILRSHPDIDITPLFEFNLTCLPMVFEWFEKAKSYLDEVNESSESFQRRQFSAVYKFIRGMPLLAVNSYRSQKKEVQLQSKSKKRTIDQI